MWEDRVPMRRLFPPYKIEVMPKKEGKALVPSFTAFAVTALLEQHFPDLVDSDFTSNLEDKLDEVANGKQDPVAYLDDYYKGSNGLKAKVDSQEDQIDPQKPNFWIFH